MEYVAVLDACVLYPAILRSFLMWCALQPQLRFCAKWTAQIHNEWMRNIIRKKPTLKNKLHRTMEMMNAALEDACIENYETIIEKLDLPDPDDRHVLASAIKAIGDHDVNKGYIVTKNLKHFPKGICSQYGIEPIHPDNFICLLVETNADAVWCALSNQKAQYKNPPFSMDDLLDSLEKQGLKMSVDFFRSKLKIG